MGRAWPARKSARTYVPAAGRTAGTRAAGARTRRWPAFSIDRAWWKVRYRRSAARSGAAIRNSARAFRGAVPSCLHDLEDLACHRVAVFHLRQLREDAFERWLAHQFAQPIDGIVRHHFALAQDDDAG